MAEIVDNLNIENPSYFIRLFRNQINLTPLKYLSS
ncbi:helix-turn-helix transcriptional regulator [Bacteroides cellulosilyticus]